MMVEAMHDGVNMRLSSPQLMEDEKVLFRRGEYKSSMRNVVVEEGNIIEINNSKGLMSLPEKMVEEIEDWKASLKKEINDLWRNIISDKEEIMFLKTSPESNHYLMTSQTILDNTHLSPKFNQALEFIFSDKVAQCQIYSGDFSDLLYQMSDYINSKNSSINIKRNIIKIKYSDIIKDFKNRRK